jgi:hypothetical protein
VTRVVGVSELLGVLNLKSCQSGPAREICGGRNITHLKMSKSHRRPISMWAL